MPARHVISPTSLTTPSSAIKGAEVRWGVADYSLGPTDPPEVKPGLCSSVYPSQDQRGVSPWEGDGEPKNTLYTLRLPITDRLQQ